MAEKDISNLRDAPDFGTSKGVPNPTGNVSEFGISLADVTYNDVSTTQHGFTPKAPNDATKVLRGDATWAVMPLSAHTHADASNGGDTLQPAKLKLGVVSQQVEWLSGATSLADISAGLAGGIATLGMEANRNFTNANGGKCRIDGSGGDGAIAIFEAWVNAVGDAGTSKAFVNIGGITFSGLVVGAGSDVTTPTAGFMGDILGSLRVTGNVSFLESGSATFTINGNGWTGFSPTCTYATATTFTIAGDYTAYFKKGTRFKLTNSTVKYFVCSADATYGAPNTTVTVTGGSDFSLANAAISAVYFSYTNPADYPFWFNWVPTIAVGYSAAPTNTVYRFSVVANTCQIEIREGTQGTSNTANDMTYSIPVTAKTITNMFWAGSALTRDNGADLATPSLLYIASAGTVLTARKDFLTANNWTATGGKAISIGNISYEF